MRSLRVVLGRRTLHLARGRIIRLRSAGSRVGTASRIAGIAIDRRVWSGAWRGRERVLRVRGTCGVRSSSIQMSTTDWLQIVCKLFFFVVVFEIGRSDEEKVVKKIVDRKAGRANQKRIEKKTKRKFKLSIGCYTKSGLNTYLAKEPRQPWPSSSCCPPPPAG